MGERRGLEGFVLANLPPTAPTRPPPAHTLSAPLADPPGAHSPLCELGVVVALAVGGAGLHSHKDGGSLAISTGAGVGDAELGGVAVCGGAHGAHICRVGWRGMGAQAGGWIGGHRFDDEDGFAIRAQEVQHREGWQWAAGWPASQECLVVVGGRRRQVAAGSCCNRRRWRDRKVGMQSNPSLCARAPPSDTHQP